MPSPEASLPSVESLTEMANELFQASATPVDGSPVPSLPVPTTVPPAAVAPPSPAVAPRLHAAPTPSAAGVAHPVPGLAASVIDLPRVPLVPEQPAPVGVSFPAGIPGLPGSPNPSPAQGAPEGDGLDALASYAVTPAWPFDFPQIPLALTDHGALADNAAPPEHGGSPSVAPASAAPPTGATTRGVPSGATPTTPAAPATGFDALAAYAVTPTWPFAFPEIPLTLDAYSATPSAISVREPVPTDAGVQAFRPELVPSLPAAPAGFDPNLARRDFPLLKTEVNGRPLIWLDNAATTQKPQAVIDRLVHFYEHENSNIHRAAHTLAARATDAYEGARESVRRFINASSTDEIVFVRGTTEGINLIAKSWGAANVGEGDEILITHLEHHANIVPWQQLCAATGATLRVAPVDNNGDVIVAEFEKLITPRTKLASITHVSNALGTVTPAAALIGIAHAHGVPVVLDAAQSIAHARIDVQSLDPDFLVFSGHKVYGPTGIGAVYGKRAFLEAMPPWEGGGNMIADVTFERTLFHGPPARFEAGTGNIADAVGLGAALDYLTGWGIDAVAAYEHSLMDYLVAGLATVPGVHLLGAPTLRAGAVSFTLRNFETAEVGQALDKEGIAVRSGHHCAQPILRRFGVETSVRPSLALYNTTADVDALVVALTRIAASRP